MHSVIRALNPILFVFYSLLLGAAVEWPPCRAETAPLDKVTFYFAWRAEPEGGGFFQAAEAGLYRKHGLDVHIELGSPQGNAEVQLSSGRVDFIEGSSGDVLNALQQNIPLVAVAAIFQKSPRVLIAHAGQGNDTLEELKGKPILIGAQALTTVWPYLKLRYGFTDDQIRPYTFNEAPFLASPQAIQEGFLTEEPYILGKLGVANPVVILLSDHGYQEYGMTLITTQTQVKDRPEVIQRFVDATLEGWHDYLFGDPSPANRYIKANNPEETDQQIAYSIAQMKAAGLVDSGDAKTLGAGAMTDAAWLNFYQTQVKAGAAPAGLDITRAYTLQFVNRKGKS